MIVTQRQIDLLKREADSLGVQIKLFTRDVPCVRFFHGAGRHHRGLRFADFFPDTGKLLVLNRPPVLGLTFAAAWREVVALLPK